MKKLMYLLTLYSVNALAHPSDYPANSMAAGANPPSQAVVPVEEVVKAVSSAASSPATPSLGRPDLVSLSQNTTMKGLIDIALLMVAGWLWFNYIADFEPAEAFMKALPPAMVTFLAFNWQNVMQWISVGI